MEVLHLLVDPVAHKYGEKSSTNRGEIHGWGGHAETTEKGVLSDQNTYYFFLVFLAPLSMDRVYPTPRGFFTIE